ncbi:AraC family transcriptional regulator [Reichenbachiella versicolor]|uniref:AraC family transcriptional regulator n=1 Tax=Reichenbachiella versicolor TaxID=1821036 RepID=UPI000D6E8931|nr:GyrI-like domain-containing protein [Reichenbachiella versicolor]
MIRYNQKTSVKDYIHRVNKVIDFLRSNIINDIKLEELAEISNFSKFHFHRIFKTITNKTPNDYIIQSRIGRAEYLLDSSLDIPISEVAYLTGFSNVSSFSKTFKKLKKASPSQWRENREKNLSKIGQEKSNIGQSLSSKEKYLASILMNQKNTDMEIKKNFKVDVKEQEDLNVSYVRNHSIHVHDSDAFGKMFDQLISWADSRGLIDFPNTKVLTVYRSMPDTNGMVTADACISVPNKVEAEGIFGSTIIEGGKYAILHKEGTLAECFTAWDYLYNNWLPNSGFQPDTRGVYLNHLNDANNHPMGHHIFDMCISIKAL